MKRLLSTSVVLGTVATVALAQSNVPQEVRARQGLMQNFAFSLSTLGNMARGNIEYDAGLAQAAADRLVTLSSIHQNGYWPDGTSAEEIEASRALPAIWESKDDFMSGFDDLHQAATAMAEVAGDGQQAVGGQMRSLGQACGGCHEDYRISDD
ncbi:c-type cytochrome [Palleronia sp.]|uniref:c-type cytochrome n=1 Tax=Palleronia sp. TaxID=1940284 RepID=UPI0035C85482